MLRLAEKLRYYLVRLPRRQKRVIQVATDVLEDGLRNAYGWYVANAEQARSH